MIRYISLFSGIECASVAVSCVEWIFRRIERKGLQ